MTTKTYSVADMIAKLPQKPSEQYDGMTLSQPHYDRLRDAYLADAPTPLQTQGYTFAGIRVAPNPAIPDGFAVLTLGNKPVGLIDFVEGTAKLCGAGHG